MPHVSVRRNAADGGGGGAQPHASTAASTAGMQQRPTSNVIQPEVAAHVSVLLGLHIISDGLTSFQT